MISEENLQSLELEDFRKYDLRLIGFNLGWSVRAESEKSPDRNFENYLWHIGTETAFFP